MEKCVLFIEKKNFLWNIKRCQKHICCPLSHHEANTHIVNTQIKKAYCQHLPGASHSPHSDWSLTLPFSWGFFELFKNGIMQYELCMLLYFANLHCYIQAVLNGGDFVLQGTFGNVWRYCWLSQHGGGWWGSVLLTLVGEGHCATEHCTVFRTTDAIDSSGQILVSSLLYSGIKTLLYVP